MYLIALSSDFMVSKHEYRTSVHFVNKYIAEENTHSVNKSCHWCEWDVDWDVDKSMFDYPWTSHHTQYHDYLTWTTTTYEYYLCSIASARVHRTHVHHVCLMHCLCACCSVYTLLGERQIVFSCCSSYFLAVLVLCHIFCIQYTKVMFVLCCPLVHPIN